MRLDTMRVLQESNSIGVQFLRTELKTGHTLLDIAEVTEVEATRMRTLRNAWHAYDLVLRMMNRLNLSLADQEDLCSGLHALKRRLDSSPK